MSQFVSELSSYGVQAAFLTAIVPTAEWKLRFSNPYNWVFSIGKTALHVVSPEKFGQ